MCLIFAVVLRLAGQQKSSKAGRIYAGYFLPHFTSVRNIQHFSIFKHALIHIQKVHFKGRRFWAHLKWTCGLSNAAPAALQSTITQWERLKMVLSFNYIVIRAFPYCQKCGYDIFPWRRRAFDNLYQSLNSRLRKIVVIHLYTAQRRA